MKNIFLAFALLTGICHPERTSAQVINLDGGTTRAVVVGISDYQNEQISDLRFADRDAEAFANYLRSPSGGNLNGDQLKLLLNEKATKAQFAAALDWLIEQSKEGDEAIIYFSGHGDVDNKIIGQEGFLLCWDTPSQSYISGAYSLYFLKLVVSTLSMQNKAKVVIIADACHAGKLSGNPIGGAQYTNFSLSQPFSNEVKILSCQPDEYSSEGEQWGGGRGAFSYHLVDGLYGMADNNTDDQVTLSEIDRYLEDNVTKEVAPMEQTPMIVGDKKERLAQVVPGILAQWKQSKSGLPMQFKATEQRGLEDETLAKVDTSIRKLYFAFKRAVQDKVFLEPADSCANAYYEKLMAVAELKPLYGAMTRNFAAALQDDAQQWINKLLQSTLVGGEWKHPKGYGVYLAKAAELLGEGHYLYGNLKGKECFFKARDFWFEKNKVLDSIEWDLFDQYLLQGLAYDDKAPYLYYHLMYRYFDARNMDDKLKAIELLKKTIELAPSWVRAHWTIGDSYMEVGYFKSAWEWYEKAKALDVDGKDPYLDLKGADIFAYQHDFEKYKSAAKEIMERKKQGYEKMEFHLSHLELLANYYWWNGYLDESEASFKDYIKRVFESEKINPIALSGTYHQLGWALVVKGNLDEAELWFQKSDSIQENSLAKAGLFQIAHKSGQFQLADEYLARAIHQVGYSASSIVGDGLFLLGIYDWQEEVILLFTKSLEHFPSHTPLHYHLARLHLEQKNDYAKGVPLLERAVALDSSHAYAHYHLAAAYAHLSKKEAALDYLEKALALGYDDPEGIEKDARWEGLRGTKRYRELVERYFPVKKE